MLFRGLFICSIGLFAYFWVDPLSIKNVPFAKLTLRQVIRLFSAAAIILSCVVWFFDFPERNRDNDHYGKWAILASFSFWCYLLCWYGFRNNELLYLSIMKIHQVAV